MYTKISQTVNIFVYRSLCMIYIQWSLPPVVGIKMGKAKCEKKNYKAAEQHHAAVAVVSETQIQI